MAELGSKDQLHPREHLDRQIVKTLLTSEPTDYNLAELGRLLVRYMGFPGARDIQSDLEKTLEKWHLTEADLYEKTHQIHAEAQVYRSVSGRQNDDWS